MNLPWNYQGYTNSNMHKICNNVLQSILGCLSHCGKLKIQTDQSDASNTETLPSIVNFIGQFGFSFFCNGTSNLKLTVTVYPIPLHMWSLSLGTNVNFPPLSCSCTQGCTLLVDYRRIQSDNWGELRCMMISALTRLYGILTYLEFYNWSGMMLDLLCFYVYIMSKVLHVSLKPLPHWWAQDPSACHLVFLSSCPQCVLVPKILPQQRQSYACYLYNTFHLAEN